MIPAHDYCLFRPGGPLGRRPLRPTLQGRAKTAQCFAVFTLFSLLPLRVAVAQTTPFAPTSQVERIVKHVAKGVDLIQEITPIGAPGGPLIVTVIEVDPHVPGTHINAGLGQDRVWNTDPTLGREVVTGMVTRHKAVAGVNGGFFPFAGNPYGMHIQDGDLVTEPYEKALRTVFYVTKTGDNGFARFTYNATAQIVTPTGAVTAAVPLTHKIDGLNKSPKRTKDLPTELLLYTPIWSPTTLPAPDRTETVLRGVSTPLVANRDYVGTVDSVATGGSTPIKTGNVVLSGVGPGADFLRAAAPGSQISFRVAVTPAVGSDQVAPETITESVSGGPRVLTDGKVTDMYAHEGMGRDMSTTSHPRTAVGRTADGKILLMTVDGRQKGLSGGAPFPLLAEILRRFGAVDGMNLDGGGSSTAVVWDGVANSPSEGIERPDADALLVYADDLPKADLPRSAKLHLPDHPLQVGELWDFSGSDLGLRGDRTVWGETGGKGFIAQDGIFHALRPGTGTITATLGSRAQVIRSLVTVVGVSKSDAAGFAAILVLLPPDPATPMEQTLTIHIANAEGDTDALEPVTLTVTGGTYAPATVTTDRHGDAKVTIIWSAPLSATAPRIVRVTSPQKRFADNTMGTIATP